MRPASTGSRRPVRTPGQTGTDRLMGNTTAGKGALVAFCGIDGCGKTTQLRLAEAWLAERGQTVVCTRQPTDFYRSHPTVRRYFRTNVAEGGMLNLVRLSASDRRRHILEVIEPALAAGSVVLCDRYYYSAEAFFFARGIDPEVVREHNRGVPKPLLTVYLDVPTRVCYERILRRDGKWSSVEEQEPGFLDKVRAGFEGAADETFLKLDGRQSIAALHHQITNHLRAGISDTCSDPSP